MNHPEYSSNFYTNIGHVSERTAGIIAPIITALLAPQRVIDVGCGAGDWLAAFKAAGAKYTLGIEGPWVDAAATATRMDLFMVANLEQDFPVLPESRFDLALCVEVGEHLDSSKARQLVQYLTSKSDTVCFSAAIPGQGGTHHINEQWQSYWASLFAEIGFKAIPALRNLIWNLDAVDPCVRQNLALYVSASRYDEMLAKADAALGQRNAVAIVDVVHPKLYEERLRTLTTNPQAIRSHLTLKVVLPSLPGLVWEALSIRVRRMAGGTKTGTMGLKPDSCTK